MMARLDVSTGQRGPLKKDFPGWTTSEPTGRRCRHEQDRRLSFSIGPTRAEAVAGWGFCREARSEARRYASGLRALHRRVAKSARGRAAPADLACDSDPIVVAVTLKTRCKSEQTCSVGRGRKLVRRRSPTGGAHQAILRCASRGRSDVANARSVAYRSPVTGPSPVMHPPSR